MPYQIIVIDDEPLIATLMKEVIEEDGELSISASTSEKDDFLNQVGQRRFDVALIDISVGHREGGLSILQALKTKQISLPVIMLSAHDEIDYALKCLQAGAKGYVNKNYICSELITAIKEVLKGNLFISGERGQYLLEKFRKLSDVPTR